MYLSPSRASGDYSTKNPSFYQLPLDAIVTIINSGEKWGIEIKCPSSKDNQHIDDVLQDKKNLFVNRKLNHKYFVLGLNWRPNILYWDYVIGGQIFCTGIT